MKTTTTTTTTSPNVFPVDNKAGVEVSSHTVSTITSVETQRVTVEHETNTFTEVRTINDSDLDDWYGSLYPSIALSDAFNAIGHLAAAFIVFQRANTVNTFAGLGFLSVWLAALIGVLRFGVSEKLFTKANRDLANLAGFVGYPLIGLSFAVTHYKKEWDMSVALGVLVAWEALTRSFLEKNQDNAKLLTNIVFFVGPVAAVSFESGDLRTLAALASFVLAGVVVTPHHDNTIAGIRCVDWFHVIIGATAYFFASALVNLPLSSA